MPWFLTTLAVALGVLVLAAVLSRPGRAPAGEPLPRTPLQRRAWLGLGLGLLALVAFAAVLGFGGIEGFDARPPLRLAVYGVLALGTLAHSLVLPRGVGGRPKRWADERDLQLFDRAPSVQGLAVLLAIAGWTIGLTEAYAPDGAVPVTFLVLVMLSTFLVHLVSLSFAVLVAYGRALRHA
jgi:hypothetical protein